MFSFSSSCPFARKFKSFLGEGSYRKIAFGYLALLLVLFTSLVFFKVHGSSIGILDGMYRYSEKTPEHSYPTIGTPQGNRSDEWNVSTLQVISQCASDQFFPRINPKIALGADMFLATPCNPVWDWTAIGQFHNWGYFLFGAERGLAWNWWCRYLGIPFFVFLFFMGRFKDPILSFTLSLAVSLGAPTIWWDTTIPYMLLYFFAGLIGLRMMFHGRLVFSKASGTLVFMVSFLSFCFTGYPIFELLLLPGFLILAYSEIWRSPAEGGAMPPADNRRTSWLFFSLAAVVIAAVFIYFLVVHAETLHIIKNSSYPGARIFRGGSRPLFFESRAYDILSVFATNLSAKAYSRGQVARFCEIVRFFVPGIAIAAALFLCFRRHIKLPREALLLLGFALLLILWGIFRWPRWLAKASGFYLFSPGRSDVIASFFLLLFSFILFAENRRAQLRVKAWIAIVLASVSSMTSVGALYISLHKLPFFHTLKDSLLLSAVLILVWAISYGLMRANRAVFCSSFLLLSLLSGSTVHPLSIGISPVQDKVLAKKVLELDRKDPGRWLVNESLTGNLVAATGVDCIPGTMEYAYPRYWSIVDPERKYAKEWDRYAHAAVDISPDETFHAKALRYDVIYYCLTEKLIRDLQIKHIIWVKGELRVPWVKYEGTLQRNFFYTVLPEATNDLRQTSAPAR